MPTFQHARMNLHANFSKESFADLNKKGTSLFNAKKEKKSSFLSCKNFGHLVRTKVKECVK